jgi:YD repeat-containing protein
LSSKTDRNGRVTEYGYDHLHRRTTEKWLDGATVVWTIGWEYNSASELTSASDPAASTTYAYYGLGRMILETQMLAGLASAVSLAHAYDANGNRTKLSSTIGSAADLVNDYS